MAVRLVFKVGRSCRVSPLLEKLLRLPIEMPIKENILALAYVTRIGLILSEQKIPSRTVKWFLPHSDSKVL